MLKVGPTVMETDVKRRQQEQYWFVNKLSFAYNSKTHGRAWLIGRVVIFVSSQSHLAELEAEEIPDEVVEQKDVVFSNIKDIYGFHTR